MFQKEKLSQQVRSLEDIYEVNDTEIAKKVHTGAKRLCMEEIDILEHHKANSSNFHTF